jgi:hypothetical protein
MANDLKEIEERKTLVAPPTECRASATAVRKQCPTAIRFTPGEMLLATCRPRLMGFALTAPKDPYFRSQDENQSSFAPLVTFPS